MPELKQSGECDGKKDYVDHEVIPEGEGYTFDDNPGGCAKKETWKNHYNAIKENSPDTPVNIHTLSKNITLETFREQLIRAGIIDEDEDQERAAAATAAKKTNPEGAASILACTAVDACSGRGCGCERCTMLYCQNFMMTTL